MHRQISFPAIFLSATVSLMACSENSDITENENSVLDAHDTKHILWSFDDINRIGNQPVIISGNPKNISNAVVFNGENDRFLVDSNPLDGATEFTIEIVFFSNSAFPKNIESRLLHIESEAAPNRRLSIELRSNKPNQWYLDTFLKADSNRCSLIDEKLLHPINKWSHVAVTYKNGTLSSYVNGIRELTIEDKVDYLPIPESAKTSIGARMNKIHWFSGSIKSIAITHKALTPGEFTTLLPMVESNVIARNKNSALE